MALDLDAMVERIARGLRAARDTSAHRVNDLEFVRNELAPDGLRALDALADEVRRLRDGMKAALTWIDTGAPVPEGRLNRVREELLIALSRKPAEEAE